MKVASCALLVVILDVVSNHRCESSRRSNPLGIITDVVGMIDPTGVVSGILGIVGGITDLMSSGLTEGENQIMSEISMLSEKLDFMETNIKNYIAGSLENLLEDIIVEIELIGYVKALNEYIGKVDKMFRIFLMYVKNSKENHGKLLNGLVNWCVSDADGMGEILRKFDALIIPQENGFAQKTLLTVLAENLKKGKGAMSYYMAQSPQQVLFTLYNLIAVTEVKGYIMIQYSWMLKGVFDTEHYILPAQMVKDNYETQMRKTLEAFRAVMGPASSSLWNGDPQETGTGYTELTWFLQAYVANEADFNNWNTCVGECSDYSFVETHACIDGLDHYCTKPTCTGRLYDCHSVGWRVHICQAPPNTNRRYISVSGDKLDNNCPLTHSPVFWKRGFVRCDYCVCYCDYECKSDRYFNLREVVADLHSNKIITGIKFVKVHQVIHLQIEQGELLELGQIANTTEWKPVHDYSIHDKGVRDEVDYKALSWDERYLDLDDLTAEPGYCLTGVRFRMLSSHLNLEIMTTPFNFTSGVVEKSLERSLWHGNDNTYRTLVELKEPDRSEKSTEFKSIPNFETNQYIQFVSTDWHKDSSQSTVPFIDTQPVVPNPRIPLVGAGIYHKGIDGYGGFIAPKVMTYDFTPHLQIDDSIPNPGVKVAENMGNGLMPN